MAYIPLPHVTTALSGPGPPHCRGFTITLRNTTLGRIPLDGLWASFLKTHNAVKRQTSMSMSPAALELAIRASKWTQTHALDRADTGIGCVLH